MAEKMFRDMDSVAAPMTQGAAVTPHASNPVASFTPRGLICAVGGTITGKMQGDASDIVFTAIAGYFYPIRMTHIRISGTTATGITVFQ